MNKHRILRTIILLILLPVILMQGCTLPTPQQQDPSEPDEPPATEDPPPSLPPEPAPPEPGQFTLRYDPTSTLNPITALNRDNILISSLLYESLFVLDGALEPHPVLCESWSTEDYTDFTFTIKTGIAMSDGSLLTAEDVVYTLRQAMLRGRYVNRLAPVAEISAEDDLTVTIGLYSPNYRFTCLLDIPIIKNGSIESLIPPGTGAYIFDETEGMLLNRFPEHRNFSSLPVTVIYLMTCADNDLTAEFDEGNLSLLWDDPADAFDIRLNRLHEKRPYETTVLQFLGFNTNHIALRDPDVRRAISASIDRQHIIDHILPLPGQAVAANVALSPSFHLYDPEWERRDLHPLEEMAILLTRAQLEDYDSDSFLEISDGYGSYYKFTIDFIVNSENIHKVRAANKITETLRQNGLDVTVRELTWDRFNSALASGDFDMYYGETQLGADFDLSPLLLPGKLNYGKTAGVAEFGPLIENFLSARTDEHIRWYAWQLCEQIKIYAPFAPILYKRHFVYYPIGAISGVSPGQSNVFRNFTDWTINLTMLT